MLVERFGRPFLPILVLACCVWSSLGQVNNETLPIPFGLCSTLVPHSMCYPLMGQGLSVLYPLKNLISPNTPLSDDQLLVVYERQIRTELDSYSARGISLHNKACRQSVLLTVCLQYYSVCSPSEPSDECRFPCDKWRAHIAGNCDCMGRADCLPQLDNLFNNCPLADGPTIPISRRKNECQRLPAGVEDSIVNTTPSADVLSCHPLSKSDFCYPVLHSSPFLHASSNSLLDLVARQRYNFTVFPRNTPYLDLSSVPCESAVRLYVCMATYTPCTVDRTASKLEYCAEINDTLVFRRMLDICNCTSTDVNCRQSLFGSVDGTLNFPVQTPDKAQIGTDCRVLPNDVRHLLFNLPPSVTPLPTDQPIVDDCACLPFEDNSSLTLFKTCYQVVLVCVFIVLCLLW